MSTELEQQIRRLTEAVDRIAAPVAEDELWHRRDADGPDAGPVTLLDLQDPPAVRRRGWILATAGIAAGLLAVTALAIRPGESARSNAPTVTTPLPQPTSSDATTTTVAVSSNRPARPNPDAVMVTSGASSVDIAVTLNDSDPDGDPLTVTGAAMLLSSIADADLTVLDDGTIRFTPTDSCVAGEYRFSYDVTDGVPGTAEATATVTVRVDPGPAPTPNADALVVDASSLPIAIPVSQLVANDALASPCLRVVDVVGVTGVTATLDNDTVIVDRAPGSSSDVLTFTYTLSNSAVRASAAVTVTLT